MFALNKNIEYSGLFIYNAQTIFVLNLIVFSIKRNLMKKYMLNTNCENIVHTLYETNLINLK